MDSDELKRRVGDIHEKLFSVVRGFAPRIEDDEPDIYSNVYMAAVREMRALDPLLAKEVVPDVSYDEDDDTFQIIFYRIN